MSLLMDALKKAEAAKRQAAQTEETGAADISPVMPTEPGKALPELPRELSLLDEQFTAQQGTPPGMARGVQSATVTISETQREREAAHNLFAAKHSPSRAPFWIGLTATTVTAVAIIGVWFWWQLKPSPGGLRPGPALAQVSSGDSPRPSAPSDAGAQPTQAQAIEPPILPAAPALSLPRAGSDNAAPPRLPPSRPPGLPTTRPTSTGSRDAARSGTLSAEPQAEDGEPSVGIRARRTTVPREQISSGVARGYAAYIAGDMASAKRQYEDALRLDPRSVDALNGMAAIALRAGRRDLAETYVSRTLEVDPKDAFALSTLASIRSQSDPQSAESRLKALIASSPDSAVAHFGLGNLYARENRWSEAQQSYFRAFSAEPDNPDFLFNLAVSLDHIRQPKLARQYYQSALAANRPGSFDREQVSARLRELQQVQ